MKLIPLYTNDILKLTKTRGDEKTKTKYNISMELFNDRKGKNQYIKKMD